MWKLVLARRRRLKIQRPKACIQMKSKLPFVCILIFKRYEFMTDIYDTLGYYKMTGNIVFNFWGAQWKSN